MTFAAHSACPQVPLALLVTSASEAVVYFNPESTHHIADTAPDTSFRLGNIDSGRAWEVLITPIPLPSHAFRGGDEVIYVALWQNPTNPPTPENAIDLDTVEFIPHRLAVVVPRYGAGVQAAIHIPAALESARAEGNLALVPLTIRSALTEAIQIGVAGIKLEEVRADGVTAIDAQVLLWQDGSQVFTRDLSGVTPARLKRQILTSGQNTYRAVLLTIAWASRYDVFADQYLVNAALPFAKHTSAVMYIPGQTVGDLPVPDRREDVLILRDLRPALSVSADQWGFTHMVIRVSLTLTNPLSLPVHVMVSLVAYKNQTDAYGQLLLWGRCLPAPVVRLAGNQSRTLCCQIISASHYFTQAEEVLLDATLTCSADFTNPAELGDIAYQLTTTAAAGTVGSVTVTGPAIAVSSGQIVQQRADAKWSHQVMGVHDTLPLWNQSPGWLRLMFAHEMWLNNTTAFTVYLTLTVRRSITHYVNGGWTNEWQLTHSLAVSYAQLAQQMQAMGFSFDSPPGCAGFVSIASDTWVRAGGELYTDRYTNTLGGGAADAQSLLQFFNGELTRTAADYYAQLVTNDASMLELLRVNPPLNTQAKWLTPLHPYFGNGGISSRVGISTMTMTGASFLPDGTASFLI